MPGTAADEEPKRGPGAVTQSAIARHKNAILIEWRFLFLARYMEVLSSTRRPIKSAPPPVVLQPGAKRSGGPAVCSFTRGHSE